MTYQDLTKNQLIAKLEKATAELEQLKARIFNDQSGDKMAYSPEAAARQMEGHGAGDSELEETKNRFYNLLQDVTQVAVQGYSLDGTTVFWNKAAELLYGYTAEEAIGQNLLDLIIPDELRERVKQEIKGMAASGKPIPSGELRLKRKDGSYVHVFSSHTLLGKPGSPPEMYCVDIDLTHRIRAEQELIKARDKAEESDRLKSAFLTNISHEIRTPMNGILGFAELLREPDLSGEKQQEYIKIIEQSGARMLDTINDIIDISRIEAGSVTLQKKDTIISELTRQIHDTLKPQADAKGLKFSMNTSVDDKEIRLMTDKDKLSSALRKLIKNAIKFTDKGDITFGYHQKDGKLEFFVRDTGIGISKDRQEAVFQPFIQADITDREARQGAGLGLAISKAYINMLGGKIWLESNEGKGSCFYFSLPLNPDVNG